jgi:hypothetical protein
LYNIVTLILALFNSKKIKKDDNKMSNNITISSRYYLAPHFSGSTERLCVTHIKCPDDQIKSDSDLPEKVDLTLTLLVDKSGSMDESLSDLISCLLTCDDILRNVEGLKINLVLFSDKARLVYQGKFDEGYRNVVKKITCNGLTNYSDALDLTSNFPGEYGSFHFVLFLTDGYPTTGTCMNTKDAKKYANKIDDCVAIGLGREINPAILSTLGDFVHIENIKTCPEVLGAIFGSLLHSFGYNAEIGIVRDDQEDIGPCPARNGESPFRSEQNFSWRSVVGKKSIGHLFAGKEKYHIASISADYLEEILKRKIELKYKLLNGTSVSINCPIETSTDPIPDHILKLYYVSSVPRLLESKKPDFMRERVSKWFAAGDEQKKIVLDALEGKCDRIEIEMSASYSNSQVSYTDEKLMTTKQTKLAQDMNKHYENVYM